MFPFKVICFYTLNTPYQQEVIHLENSCASFGIPCEIEGIESRGSWEKNLMIKPEFILKKWESSSVPLLWVDADGVFLQKPDFSFLLSFDFAVRFMEVFQHQREHAINAATIFVNKTERAKNLLKNWVKRCEELKDDTTISIIDQVALYDVLLENREAKVYPLPVQYCKIYDIDSFFINDEEVIIEQRQASRRYKDKVPCHLY